MAQSPVKTAAPHLRPLVQCEERWPDCWPDWDHSAEDEDPETMNAMIRENSPRLVFSEIGRILTAILFVVALVSAALGAFHIH